MLVDIIYWIFGIFVVIHFVYILYEIINAITVSSSVRPYVLVTAHPDDECMFFLPFILSNPKRNRGNLCCLSYGATNAIADIRRNELQSVCSVLNLEPLELSCEPLVDGMAMDWTPEQIGLRLDAIYAAMEAKYGASWQLITFDGYGVSGHPNHIAISRGVKAWMAQRIAADKKIPSIFELQSRFILFKYLGLLDALFSFYDSLMYPTFFLPPSQILQPSSLLALHQSQFVWYRKLSIFFSRYSYLNHFTPLS